MEITSFSFLCFFAVILAVYYLVPRRLQWPVLLAATGVFFMRGAHPLLLLYPAGVAVLSHVCATRLYRMRNGDAGVLKKRGYLLAVCLLIQFGLLFALKIGKLIRPEETLLPVGLSFYTFILYFYFHS